MFLVTGAEAWDTTFVNVVDRGGDRLGDENLKEARRDASAL